jgi:hypothetical protein
LLQLVSDYGYIIAVGIPAVLATLTAVFGDKVAERIFLRPVLKLLQEVAGWKVVEEALGPMLRVNMRRITIYHYFTFAGIEAAVPLASGIVQGSGALTALYLGVSVLMFGTIGYFVLLRRETFDWWRRIRWRFTMVGLSTVAVFSGRDLVAGFTTQYNTVIGFALLVTFVFVVSVIYVNRLQPGLGGVLLDIAEGRGERWFDVDEAINHPQVQGRARRDIIETCWKLCDMEQLDYRIHIQTKTTPEEENSVVLHFRKRPGLEH